MQKSLFHTCTSCVWSHYWATAECPGTVLNTGEAGALPEHVPQEMWVVPLSKHELFVLLNSLALETPLVQSVVNAECCLFLQHAKNYCLICCCRLTILKDDPLNVIHYVLMHIPWEKIKMQCSTLALCGHNVVHGQVLQKCLSSSSIMCSLDLCCHTVTGSKHLLIVLYKTEITLVTIKIATSKSRHSLWWEVQQVQLYKCTQHTINGVQRL